MMGYNIFKQNDFLDSELEHVRLKRFSRCQFQIPGYPHLFPGEFKLSSFSRFDGHAVPYESIAEVFIVILSNILFVDFCMKSFFSEDPTDFCQELLKNIQGILPVTLEFLFFFFKSCF